MSVERRRYYRITDNVDLSFRVRKPQIPDLKLSTTILDNEEMLKVVEGELETVLNVIWNSEPQLARTLGLLNQKINLLASTLRPSQKDIMEQYDHQYSGLFVSLSASGMAFDCDVELQASDRLELYLLLDSSISGLLLKGTVISVEIRQVGSDRVFFTCIEFDIDNQQKEQLIQHVARRQLKSIRDREHGRASSEVKRHDAHYAGSEEK